MDPVILRSLVAAAYTIPTDGPEGDGTLAWNKTTLVLSSVEAGGKTGIGYSYTAAATVQVITDVLAPALKDANVLDIPACWRSMRVAVRNLGLGGIAAMAIAAVDTALWDLKAKLLGVSLADLFGLDQPSVPVYGSGGFTTYDDQKIEEQIASWQADGITMAKIKIGTHPEQDLDRVEAARSALGSNGQLFVDANGAYTVKQALAQAELFAMHDVKWFEEPVSSDDLEGLNLIRQRAPAGMDIAAGEYGFDEFYFRRMLDAGAVDVLQVDATRAQGYTGFMMAAALAAAHNRPISSHCAPALHLPVCAATPGFRHMEYFHDHARIERMLFDGVPNVTDGRLALDRSAPGHGLTFKSKDAEKFRA